MRQVQVRRSYFSRMAEHLGISAREAWNATADQPVPERWVDLINYLNAQEEEQPKLRLMRDGGLYRIEPVRRAPGGRSFGSMNSPPKRLRNFSACARSAKQKTSMS